MNQITIVFTKRKLNPGSWLIRWALPRSRFKWAISSHCMIEDGDFVIEANMLHGVRRVLRDEAMKGLTVVQTVSFSVPDADAGLRWARDQVGQEYDFKGAFGLALAPDRNWIESGSWFCYELAAGAILQAGRDAFRLIGHVTESQLLLLKP